MDLLTLRDFRCFHDKQSARLAPLTILVGENSTGKTSFLAMIRALWNIAYGYRVPDFKEDPYDLGSFDEIAHHRGGKGRRAESFEAKFAVRMAGTDQNTQRVAQTHGFEVTFAKHGTVPFPAKVKLSQHIVWVECLLDGKNWQVSFGTPRGHWELYRSFTNGLGTDYEPLLPPFFHMVSQLHSRYREGEVAPIPLHNSQDAIAEDLEMLDELVLSWRSLGYFASRLYASAPVRSRPRRTYDPSRPTPDPEGDYVPMFLASTYFRDPAKWKELKSALESFGKSAGLFDEISIKALGKRDSEPFQVQIRKTGNKLKGPRRNLIDVGYGVSQVLPVITELLRGDTPPMFLLQQPEVHLHPSAQAALGSLFCRLAKPDRQLIVETHSDHMLDRVRMDVRDGTTDLKPEDVSILFFERGDLEVNIHSLRIDEQGNITGAPNGYRRFFMDETRRSLGL